MDCTRLKPCVDDPPFNISWPPRPAIKCPPPTPDLVSPITINAGIVTAARVHDDQSVHQGDLLAEIFSDRDGATLGDSRTLVSQQLHNQRDTLQTDLEKLHQVFQQKRDVLRNKVDSLHNQIVKIDTQLDLQKQQVSSNQRIAARVQSLIVENYISNLQVDQLTQSLLSAQNQYDTMVR